MERGKELPRFWLIRRIRRWVVKPQKEIARWQRRWRSSPFVVLPKFLRESRQLLELILRLKPDIVLGNARSGSPYVRVIEHRLKEAGIEVRYERLCSAWGHKLHFALKPAASVHWLHEALAQRKRVIMVDVSRKPFSDAQRIVGGVIVWLYNEAVSKIIGELQPLDLVPSITRQMRDYLRRQPNFVEAVDEICELLRNMGQGTRDEGTGVQSQVSDAQSPIPSPQSQIPFARHLLVRNLDNFSWDDEHGCLLPINISREAWIDDRTDKYAWLPFIARWFI
ncbi:MAG: hypothetical protein N3B10_09555 [Armatimonadetes bacterium]|nr:hypothetical protein [Armatimonadota bacterium]MCX7968714.1 hypothetical protein [Armatimonadota bacterium]MDW8144530.1 hypothetical protein [Armatimonadota bacterium]